MKTDALPTDLVGRLRALAAAQHSDISVADEAADEIERLRDKLKHVANARLDWGLACDCYCESCEMLDEMIREATR